VSYAATTIVAARDMTVDLRRIHLAEPLETTVETTDHQLILFLPPTSSTGLLRCQRSGHGRFTPAMPLRFRPAGVSYDLRGMQGDAMVLRQRFSNTCLSDVIGEDFAWDSPRIGRCLDLSRSRLMPLLMKLRGELASPGLGSNAMVEAIATMAMIELVRFAKTGEDEREFGGTLDPRVQSRLRERIEANELPPPSVHELAQLCGMSERNLLRLFRATNGETVSASIRRSQLTRARHLLTTNDEPLKKIAFRVGFSQPSAFIAAFRRASGETPDQFRRRLGSGLNS
jgi:AraC family transcriptional regulator